MSDLEGKYQKLATEYAKLRAQLPVLKKAVKDEQAKEEELKDDINQKNQAIRKFEQEIDSLTFRNQQLASRVTVLQQELEGSEAKGKKQKHARHPGHPGHPEPSLSNSPGSSVMGEELHSKIEENARLHKQVYERTIEHEQITGGLKDRLAVLEVEAQNHAGVVSTLTSQHKEKLDKLQEEKALIEARLQRQERECKDAMTRADLAESRLKSIEGELSGNLASAKQTIRDKLPFNDTQEGSLNTLNIPTYDRRHEMKSKDLVSQAATLVKELVQGLSNYHTYSEQRLRSGINGNDVMSDVNKRLSALLLSNATHLRPVEQTFKTFHEQMNSDSLTTLETAVGLQDFADKFHKYSVYTSKLLPYQLLSIEEETSQSACTKSLEVKNGELGDSCKQFVSSLSKVDTYTALLASQSSTRNEQPVSSQNKIFLQLSESVADFHSKIKDMSRIYNSKVTLEHQLPTATRKIKTTDECIVSSLINLVSVTNRLSTFLSNNVDFFCERAGYKTRGCHLGSTDCKLQPVVGSFHQRNAAYIASLSRAPSESVPYKIAVENRTTLLRSTESRAGLTQQVQTYNERISKLEQDKEHWMLEAQLLQMKFEKEKMRTMDLERIAGNVASGTSNPPATSSRPSSISDSAFDLGFATLGKLDVNKTDNDLILREQLIKDHYSQRISELSSQLQTADSKAMHFSAECRALHKRLNMSAGDKTTAQDELSTAIQTVSQLKDELQTTTRSYEGQLSMMSEHLAGMNEKLTNQKDEIDLLRYQLNNPKAHKNKGR